MRLMNKRQATFTLCEATHEALARLAAIGTSGNKSRMVETLIHDAEAALEAVDAAQGVQSD